MKQMMIVFFLITYLITTFISLATECGEKKLLNETCFTVLREQQLIIPHPGSFFHEFAQPKFTPQELMCIPARECKLDTFGGQDFTVRTKGQLAGTNKTFHKVYTKV